MGFDSISSRSSDRPRSVDDPYRRWPDGSSQIETADRSFSRRLPALPSRLPQSARLNAIKMNPDGPTSFGDLEPSVRATLHHERATFAGTAAAQAWDALVQEFEKSSVLRTKLFNDAQRLLFNDAAQASRELRPALALRAGRFIDVFAFLSTEPTEHRKIAQQWLQSAEIGAKNIGNHAVAAEARRELRDSLSLSSYELELEGPSS